MPTPLYLEDIQPFIDFTTGNLGTKTFTVDPFIDWRNGVGRPVVATGVGYGVSLGSFPVLQVDGDWDMTSVSVRDYLLQYPPLDGVAEVYNALPFPVSSPAGDVHSFVIQEGGLPGAYIAATDNGFQLITFAGVVGDVSVPVAAGYTAALVEIDMGLTAPPADGQVLAYGEIVGTNDAATKRFTLAVGVLVTGMGPSLQVSALYARPGGTDSLSSTLPIAIVPALPSLTRVVMYVDGATRQVGVIIDGNDYGWLRLPTLAPFTLPSDITTLSLNKIGMYDAIPVADPQIGSTVSVLHSIDVSLITETLPGTLGSWYTMSVADPTPPLGYGVGSRYYAAPGGSYGGVGAETGDIVEFVAADTIFTYPLAASLVRLSQYSLDIGNLQTDLANYQLATDTHLSALDGRATNLETTTGDHETRISDLEGEVALLGVPDILQRAMREAEKGGHDFNLIRVTISDDLPVSGFAGVDAIMVGNTPSGDFAGFPAGNLVFQDGITLVSLAPPEGLSVFADNAGDQASAQYGGALRRISGQSNGFARNRTGLELANVPPQWVCVKRVEGSDSGSPRWVFSGSDPSGADVYPEKHHSPVIIMDATYTGPGAGVTLHFDAVSSVSGHFLIDNQSSAEINATIALYNGPPNKLVMINEDTGEVLGPTPVLSSQLLGVMPPGGKWRVEWFMDAQDYNAGTGSIVLYSRIRDTRVGSSTASLTATVLAATTLIPAGAELVTLSASPGITTQVYQLPRVLEGRRIVLKSTAVIAATFTTSLPDSVDSSCASLQMVPGSLYEVGYKNKAWYLLAGSSSNSSQGMVLTATTTTVQSAVLTVDGTGSVTVGNVPETCPLPAGTPHNSAQATHRIIVEACGSAKFYFKEFSSRTRCVLGGSANFIEVGETIIAEEWDVLTGSDVSVSVTATNADGLLRITVNSNVNETLVWKASVTTLSNVN